MDKKKSGWVHLYNCLFLVSSEYDEIKELESPIFDIFNEIDSTLTAGFNNEILNFFEEMGWINEALKIELYQFRDFVDAIESKYWNPEDFEKNEDWLLVRSWARSLMNKLDMKIQGWNNDGSITIYTKD